MVNMTHDRNHWWSFSHIALIIGDVLGWEKPGIGDIWLVERIRWMLSAGELRMVREDRERFYRSVVERA